MKVCILGAKGNMGRRYSAICKSEGIDFIKVDKEDSLCDEIFYEKITHYIVATPTNKHVSSLIDIHLSNHSPVSVLVEKPIDVVSKFERGLKAVKILEKVGHKVYMVNNYAYYSHGITEPREGDTVYNFYNSGKDGLGPDCIQLIHLARGPVLLSTKSPIWRCEINGTPLSRELIDLCYVKMIKDFVTDGEQYRRLWGWKDIKAAHRKVTQYEKNLNRGPSEDFVY